MPVYAVATTATISLVKEVEAGSSQEAIKKAGALVLPTLCHQCSQSGEGEDECWELTGSLDGEPSEPRVTQRVS